MWLMGLGLRIIDVSDPAHPAEVGFYDTPRSANGTAVSSNYIYIADDDGGVLVVKLLQPVVYLPLVVRNHP